MSESVVNRMLRESVLVDDVTLSKLDANVLEELVSCLWPKDCQSCGWSLGSEQPCALVVDVSFTLAHATLHHKKCASPRWNDSGFQQHNGAPLISWVANGVIIPTDTGNPKDSIPGMVLNPSLEMATLYRANGGKWELDTLKTFREMGFRRPKEGIYLGRAVPRSAVIVTPTSWRIHLAGGFDTYEVCPNPEMNALARRKKGIFAVITQAADPTQLRAEIMNTVMTSRQTVAGWVPLH